MMKSFFKKLAFTMAAAMVVSAAAPAGQAAYAADELDIALQSAKSNAEALTSYDVEVGETVDFKFYGEPNYKTLNPTWSSDLEAVAKVDQSGKVTGVKDGFATITFEVSNGKSGSIEIKVGDPVVYDVALGTAKDATFSELTLALDETKDLGFFGVKDWKASNYKCEWSVEGDAVTVDNKTGVVTAVKAGEATVNFSIVNKTNGVAHKVTPVVVTVPEPENFNFTAKQTTEAFAELTFEDKDITLDEIKAGLSCYWYAADYTVAQPFEVVSVDKGVAKVNVFSFTDGIVYGFNYKDVVSEFTATIGDVTSIELVFAGDKVGGSQQYAYVNQEGFVSYKLYNAKGVDITNVGLPTGAYVNYTISNESLSGEYYLTDPTGVTGSTEGKIMFTVAGKVAKIKGEYVTGKYDETTGAPIPGPVAEIEVVAVPKPAYALGSAEATITTKTASKDVDWNNKSSIIALGDEKATAHKLVVKFVSNDNTKVNSMDTIVDANGATAGYVTFKSNNNAVAYVDANTGNILTNGVGSATVLVYFTPIASTANPNPTASLVTAFTITVKPTRAASFVTVDANNKTVSVEAGDEGFNKVSFNITVKDQLQAEFAKTPEVKHNGATLPTGITAPVPVVTKVADKTGQYTVAFEITDAKTVLPADSTSYPFTYTVKVGDAPAQTIILTVKSPIRSNTDKSLILSGQEIGLGGASDLKTDDIPTVGKDATAKLYLLSNSVRVNVANLIKKVDGTTMYVGNYYYTVTKDGKDITKDGTTVTTATGSTITIPLTKIDTVSASGTSIDGIKVVNKTANGTGTYVITVSKAIGATAGATTQAFTTVATKTLTVKDTQDAMSYVGKDNALPKLGNTVESIVMNCFEFKLGGTTLTETKNYTDAGIKISVDANAPAGYSAQEGAVVFVKSVTFYVPTKTGSDVYNQYKIDVNDYVTMTK